MPVTPGPPTASSLAADTEAASIERAGSLAHGRRHRRCARGKCGRLLRLPGGRAFARRARGDRRAIALHANVTCTNIRRARRARRVAHNQFRPTTTATSMPTIGPRRKPARPPQQSRRKYPRTSARSSQQDLPMRSKGLAAIARSGSGAPRMRVGRPVVRFGLRRPQRAASARV
jgi:hypothetical protein